MSRDEWRRAVRPASKRDHYNVRVISRGHDGTLMVLDLSDVPKEQWRRLFDHTRLAIGTDAASATVKMTPPTEVLAAFVNRGRAAQAAVDEIIKKVKP